MIGNEPWTFLQIFVCACYHGTYHRGERNETKLVPAFGAVESERAVDLSPIFIVLGTRTTDRHKTSSRKEPSQFSVVLPTSLES